MQRHFSLITAVIIAFSAFYAGNITAAAAEGYVSSIEVEGIKRIEKETVLSYLTIKQGDELSDESVNESLKALFATGLFSDVSLVRNGDVLVVDVVENPIINEIAFEGNDALKEENLLSEIKLRPRVVYTRSRVQDDVKRLLQVYRRSGRFAAVVDPKIVVLDQNRVNLVFEINEGKKTYVQSIKFIGNKRYSDSALRDEIMSKETRWYNFLTSSDTYDPDRINYDTELLRRFYLSKGYADFKVETSAAELSSDKNDFFVTFTISEGERYDFGKININNNLKGVDVNILQQQLTATEGEVYNADLVESSIGKMTDAAADMQYGFVSIKPDVNVNRAQKKVDITFNVAESPRVFVGNINIKGNVRTLDKVVRREFELSEGDPYNLSKIKKSEQKIRDLDFFDNVKVEPKKGDKPDRSDIDVTVSEKSTGEISIGGGFSTDDGPLADFSIRERNLLGRGQDLKLGTTISGKTQQFDLSFTEPYFLERDLSAGFDIYHTMKDYQDESSYDLKRTGGALRLGYPLSKNLRQNLKYSGMTTEIENVQPDASTYITEQEGSRVTSKIGQELVYDTRDSKITPTEGWVASIGTDVAGLGGDAKFLSFEGKLGKYFPVFDESVFSLLSQGGYIVGYGDEDVTIAERFFIGGSKLRGFETAGIGPRDSATSDALGGNQYIVGSAEFSSPVGLSKELGIKGHLFTDAGTLSEVDSSGSDVLDNSSIRLSSGFGLSWASPMGPIRVDMAFPIMKEDYDKQQQFRFSFGTRF